MSQDSNQDEFDTAVVFHKTASATSDSFTVKPGVTFPSVLKAEGVHTGGMKSATIDAVLEWDTERRAYSLKRLAINAIDGSDITAGFLKRIPVKVVRELVIRAAMPSSFFEVAGRKEPEDYARLVTGRLTDELLREVALRAAVRHGLYGDPNREVMECFGVPQRTATHWIARARAQGFLD